MDREQIIKELKAERDRLNRAITALEEEPHEIKAPARPRLPQGVQVKGMTSLEKVKIKPKRQVSEESRRKMSEAQKRRWEATRKKK